MKTIKKLAFSTMLTGVLMSNVSFAGYPDDHDIERSCYDLVEQLNSLIYSKSNDACAGDVGIAAAYIDAAALKVRYQKYSQALTSMRYGEHELRAITKRSYCTNFSTEIKPLIAKVIRLGSEIEILERFRNQTSVGFQGDGHA